MEGASEYAGDVKERTEGVGECTEGTGQCSAGGEEPDPIYDIADYLARCARDCFPRAPTRERARFAAEIFARSPSDFLERFGERLVEPHLLYLEQLQLGGREEEELRPKLQRLRRERSAHGIRTRLRNRRYRALRTMQEESDYFSDREMMFRNPLLYERLVGRYLTDQEVATRDAVDSHQLTLVGMILDTVDRNRMRETKNEQMLVEKMEHTDITELNTSQARPNVASNYETPKSHWGEFVEPGPVKSEWTNLKNTSQPRWGDFNKPDTTPSFEPEVRKRRAISAPERDLLRREFLHEMYSSFMEGKDLDFDYSTVDDNEQYDDLQLINRDKEEEYFDSETPENENLEETMTLVHEYGRKTPVASGEDELDVFMEHLNKRHSLSN